MVSKGRWERAKNKKQKDWRCVGAPECRLLRGSLRVGVSWISHGQPEVNGFVVSEALRDTPGPYCLMEAAHVPPAVQRAIQCAVQWLPPFRAHQGLPSDAGFVSTPSAATMQFVQFFPGDHCLQ